MEKTLRSTSLLGTIEPSREKGNIVWAVVWAAVAAIAAVATLVVTIATLVISVKTYNDRYNVAYTDASAAAEVTYEFKKNGKTTGTGTVTMTAGSIYYGYYQASGAKSTKYALSYKKSTSKSYTTLKSAAVCAKNNVYYGGDYKVTTAKSAAKYDLKVVKNSNEGTASKFVFDWLVA